jgi:hypothetical protein
LAGHTARELQSNEACGPGWTLDGETFSPPAPRPPLTDIDELSATVVALALLTLDEINNLRQWVGGFKAATAAATSLADLKTRVASLPNTPDRTRAQLLAAVRAKLTDGSI